MLVCQAVSLSRAAFYRPVRDFNPGDAMIVDALNEVIAQEPR